jgi:catechol 2,3-dioxygenase-like lactoylglutathione lyase family enzyme
MVQSVIAAATIGKWLRAAVVGANRNGPTPEAGRSLFIVAVVFDHVTIRVSDPEASERFYRTVLPTLGIEPTSDPEDFVEWDDFSIAQADGEHPVTRRLHIAFVAPTREHVDTFWRAGTDAGFRDDGPPGQRPEYGPDYYGGFLLDPDGNSAEAVHH